MAKGTHPGRISAEKIEKVYLDWVDGMTLTELKNKYEISIKTIVKYRDENGWAQRKNKIQSVVAKRLDKTVVTRKARRARIGVKLQAEGLKSIKKGIVKQSDAIAAIKLGAEFEDQAHGEVDEGAVITIKLPKGMTLGNRLNPTSSDNE